jgi:hypothetical protein
MAMFRALTWPVILCWLILLILACGSNAPASGITAPEVSVPPALRDFQLSGAVTDAVNRPLSGVRIEVIDGARAGTVATTDESGRFSMPGTFTGNITLTLSKDGYRQDTRPLFREPFPMGGVGQLIQFSFRLESLLPSPNLAGVYTLTLTADNACQNLPAEARTRTYAATVPGGAGSSVIGTVSGGRFLQTPPMACAAVGWCSYDRIRVSTVGDYASVFVGIVEQLGEANYLAITAGAEGVFGPNGMAAPSSGVFLYCPGSPPYQVDQGVWGCRETGAVECGAYDQHQLTLTRR